VKFSRPIPTHYPSLAEELNRNPRETRGEDYREGDWGQMAESDGDSGKQSVSTDVPSFALGFEGISLRSLPAKVDGEFNRNADACANLPHCSQNPDLTYNH
jgi:hypothetical protein